MNNLHCGDNVGPYILKEEIGKAYKSNCPNEYFALKVAPLEKSGKGKKGKVISVHSDEANQLFNESNCYRVRVGKHENIPSFPVMNPYGDDKEHKVRYFAMDLLGLSLDKVVENCGGRLCMNDVYRCGLQMINVLKHLHSRNLVHRDIKPQNFMFGLPPKENILYIIDFGSIDSYKTINGVYKGNGKFVGTPEYASYRVHNGACCLPRDDLISVGYILIKLLIGKLPWSDCKSSEEVKKMMNKIDIKELCKDVNKPLKEYLECLYNETIEIDYDYLMNLFKNELKGEDENIFDFYLSKNKNKTKTPSKPRNTPKRKTIDNDDIDDVKLSKKRKLSSKQSKEIEEIEDDNAEKEEDEPAENKKRRGRKKKEDKNEMKEDNVIIAVEDEEENKEEKVKRKRGRRVKEENKEEEKTPKHQKRSKNKAQLKEEEEEEKEKEKIEVEDRKVEEEKTEEKQKEKKKRGRKPKKNIEDENALPITNPKIEKSERIESPIESKEEKEGEEDFNSDDGYDEEENDFDESYKDESYRDDEDLVLPKVNSTPKKTIESDNEEINEREDILKKVEKNKNKRRRKKEENKNDITASNDRIVNDEEKEEVKEVKNKEGKSSDSNKEDKRIMEKVKRGKNKRRHSKQEEINPSNIIPSPTTTTATTTTPSKSATTPSPQSLSHHHKHHHNHSPHKHHDKDDDDDNREDNHHPNNNEKENTIMEFNTVNKDRKSMSFDKTKNKTKDHRATDIYRIDSSINEERGEFSDGDYDSDKNLSFANEKGEDLSNVDDREVDNKNNSGCCMF